IGLLVITRIIGPKNYGPYVAALGICQYALNVGQAGIAVFLVRQANALDRKTEDTANALLLLFGGAVVCLLELSTNLIAQWVTMPAIKPLLIVLPFRFRANHLARPGCAT